MRTLFVAWQNPESRHWFVVGRLSKKERTYQFVYTHGSTLSDKFVPFGRMKDLHSTYESEELFPLFSDRLLARNRPEYKEYSTWLHLSSGANELDPFDELARTGGTRATDSLSVFACPEPDVDGTYNLTFFSHGIRYLPTAAQVFVGGLEAGRALFLMLDNQNSADTLAVAMRTEPPMIVGYVPRYYCEDVRKLIESKFAGSVKVWVEKVNLDAPIQLRLLCAIRAPWPESFKPCSGEQYTPLA